VQSTRTTNSVWAYIINNSVKSTNSKEREKQTQDNTMICYRRGKPENLAQKLLRPYKLNRSINKLVGVQG